MEKISVLLKLGYKFSKKYIPEYFSALAKPFLFALVGVLFLFTVFIDARLALLALLSIPFMCYAFWKGYVITYGLIACADNFIKNTALPFENFSKEIKKNENEFAKYVCFTAIVTIILYSPAFFYTLYKIPALDFFGDMKNILTSFDNVYFLADSIVLAPLLNYFLCAFYYKKEEEKPFDLLLNCYKKIDLVGFILSFVITLFSLKGGVIYVILALFLNPFIYSVNTFWYSSRMKIQNSTKF